MTITDLKTYAERYPLIKSPLYRRCLEDVIRHVRTQIDARGGAYALKSCPMSQIARAGNLNADYMLQHFAGIFDGNSPLSSGQRRAVKAILTDAAGHMAMMAAVVKEQATKEANQSETTKTEQNVQV